MKKNEKTSEERIKLLVNAFIESEIKRYKQGQFGLVRKYFRYVHLGNRLTRKISAASNELFILRSAEGDAEIRITKGRGSVVPKIVTIKNNELCWLQD